MERKAYGEVLLAGVLWGTIGLFVKILEIVGASSDIISLYRVFFTFLVMFTIVLFKYGLRTLRVPLKTVALCASLGIVCNGIFNIFYSNAIIYGGVGLSAMLQNLAPVTTAVLSWMLFKENMNGKKIAALIINIIGCTLAVMDDSFSLRGATVMGIVWGVLAGIFYGLTAIFGKIARDRTDVMVVTTYSFLFATLFLLGWNLIRGVNVIATGEIAFWGFLYGLVATSFPYLLYYHALNRITETSKVPILSSIECVVAVIIGVFLFKETVGIVNIIGFILVFVALLLLNNKKPKTVSPS